jgi:glycosyltransferase involved in cell wall biosynthesis
MSTKKPLVSVLMAVYNGEKFLREAIESILNQTYTNFEFLIVNDGSTDLTEEIILSYSDSRIRYIKNETNLKLITSLNKGLDLANGKYIARMDADDISLPNRLEKQVVFLEDNQEIGVLGTCVRTIGLENNYEVHFKQGHDQIRFELFFHNYLHHPTVMLRSDLIKKNKIYYENYLHAEDYALWVKLTEFTKIDILPEILVNYRIHESNISEVHKNQQLIQTSYLRKKQIQQLGIDVNDDTFKIYEDFIDSDTIEKLEQFTSIVEIMQLIIHKNKESLGINNKLLFNYYNTKLNNYLEQNCWRMGSEIKTYFNSIFNISIKTKYRFIFKQSLRLKSIWN